MIYFELNGGCSLPTARRKYSRFKQQNVCILQTHLHNQCENLLRKLNDFWLHAPYKFVTMLFRWNENVKINLLTWILKRPNGPWKNSEIEYWKWNWNGIEMNPYIERCRNSIVNNERREKKIEIEKNYATKSSRQIIYIDSRYINCGSHNCLVICAENQKSMKANAFHFAYVIITPRLCAAFFGIWYSVSSTHTVAQRFFRISKRWNSVRIHSSSALFFSFKYIYRRCDKL